jgi:thermostable 8-oxoguanine DNA glycosylase
MMFYKYNTYTRPNKDVPFYREAEDLQATHQLHDDVRKSLSDLVLNFEETVSDDELTYVTKTTLNSIEAHWDLKNILKSVDPGYADRRAEYIQKNNHTLKIEVQAEGEDRVTVSTIDKDGIWRAPRVDGQEGV